MINVVGTLFLILLFTSGNVERSVCRHTTSTESGARKRSSNRRSYKTQKLARSFGILGRLPQPISWLADRVLGWFPFYQSIKTLAVLACAYWRLELVAVPLLKRHERQIDLTLSLLYVTFGVLYHLAVELPRALIRRFLRSWSLWLLPCDDGGSSDVSDTQCSSREKRQQEAPPATSKTTSKRARRRVSPSSNASQLPQWPPTKRSVFSGDSSTTRKPSLGLPRSRSSKPTASVALPPITQPTKEPATERRPVSGTSRVISGGERHRGREDRVTARRGPTQGNAIASTAAKLKSLPRPPSGDLNHSSGSTSSGSTSSPTDLRPSKQAASKAKAHQDHADVLPQKRSRNVNEDERSPSPERHTTRQRRLASRETGNGVKRLTVKERATLATASTVKAKSASSTAAGKRRRTADPEGEAALPKRVRSTRSTTAKRTTA
ncbi:hypothetical protein A1Q2_07983 [Trichosporon asahii var. asahii CBS 8904]|uniref:Uncharacterized protein n=1 Tax=Trichosporon asahii var. asahii (strain CBS 8904) TaxID=1220162 RepID=K1V1I0_TRIAC|nr:hypothetical protein A1Q2_07983 [Trichosporon asahii var. asahii CBS 8904]